MADGTMLSMPDTPENQKTYPQQPGQKEGLGFPILRLVGLISLSCGAVLNVEPNITSTKCSFCGSNQVLEQQVDLNLYRPESAIV